MRRDVPLRIMNEGRSYQEAVAAETREARGIRAPMSAARTPSMMLIAVVQVGGQALLIDLGLPDGLKDQRIRPENHLAEAQHRRRQEGPGVLLAMKGRGHAVRTRRMALGDVPIIVEGDLQPRGKEASVPTANDWP